MSDSENGKGDNESTQPDVKEEDNEDQKESADSKQEEKSTNEEKKPRKTTKEEDDEEDEGSDESEEEVGLLDRPVEVTGSRERKKVERLEVNFKTPSKDKPEIPEGRGEKLGECPRIEFKVQKTPIEELKALHKLLFNRPGSANEIKRNIRKFCGFTFTEGSQEYERKKAALDKLKLAVLKQMCEILDIERSGVREEIALRILQFLLEPKSSGKAVPVSKSKKRSSTKGGKAKQTEKDKKSTKGSAKKRKKDSGSDDEGSDESAEKEDEEDEQDAAAADDSADSYEEPKKKKKAQPKKKKEAPLKEKKKEKNGEKSKKSEDKKTPAKSAKRKTGGSSEDSDESSDGEPLAKKVKSPPSDDEIKQLVKKILDDADLEEITMKKVIKQVFDAYPDFDLSEKKDYIKATVKSVIS